MSEQTDTDRSPGSGPAQRVMMSEGEWNGLSDLLRAFADGEEEKCHVDGVSPEEFARNYADYIDENRSDWP